MPKSTTWVADIIANNKWESNIFGHFIKVTLQSRPVSQGVWEDKWVWDSHDGEGCGDLFFDTPEEALDHAYGELAPSDPPKRGTHFVDVYIHVVLDVSDPQDAPQIAKVEVTSNNETKEADLVESGYYDRDGVRYKLLEDDSLNWILGLEAVYY